MATSFDDLLNRDISSFIELIQRHHAGQMRAGGTAQWEHCVSVMKHLEQALEREEAVDPAARRDMLLAALGHDLYEDTAIDRKEVVEEYGEHVDTLISTLTNPDGDTSVERYVKQVIHGSEETRLLKLCDAIDNYGGVVRNMQELGEEWITGFFLPLVEPMYTKLRETEFVQYPHASRFLIEQIDSARGTLLSRKDTL